LPLTPLINLEFLGHTFSSLFQFRIVCSNYFESSPVFYCFSVYVVPTTGFCLIIVIFTLIVIFLLMKLTFYSKQSVFQSQLISFFYLLFTSCLQFFLPILLS
jgi:hypothetical protein